MGGRPDWWALAALHGHFLLADAVKQFLLEDLPVDEETASRLGDDLLAASQISYRVFRLQVFYALMYVVVEGYLEVGYRDPSVDRLLAQSQFVETFRRFRNATFHFQRELVSPKVKEFMETEGSEDWAYDLYGAMKAFFEKELQIKEFFDSLPKHD